LRKQLPDAIPALALALAACTLLLAHAPGCDESDHAPHGSSSGGPVPSGSDMDIDADSDADSDSDSDSDADTNEDAGTGGCLEDEIAQPDSDRCWLRCPLGQVWNDGYCDGSVQAYDWEAAVAACALIGVGHHLATRQEMIDILDNCEEVLAEDLEGFCDPCGASAACGALFGFDSLTYWTSTDGLYSPWAVAFDTGLVFMSDTEFDYHYARCLREL
jgi:hypothetical protein